MKTPLVLIILATCTALLSGCVTVEEMYAPDGSKALVIDCSTTGSTPLNWGDCQKKASEICGDRGYGIISKDTDSNTSGSGVVMSRTMMIRCRGEEPSEPAENEKWRKLG